MPVAFLQHFLLVKFLCAEKKDFNYVVFDERTVILCDQVCYAFLFLQRLDISASTLIYYPNTKMVFSSPGLISS
jgi:hypothetical protein